jgi:hypothetical protein
MQIVPYILEVDGQEIILTPDVQHEYLVTTDQVALGYDVTPENIRKHKETKGDELVEGKHWVVSNTHTPGGMQLATLWTKRGIVRLGFFIRSARARKFRDLAEDLVIENLEAPAATGLISARLIAAAMGIGAKSAVMRMKRSGILPTHHFLESRAHAGAYLWPLASVQAMWPEYSFAPFPGEVRPGIEAVQSQYAAARRIGNKPKQQLLFSQLTPTQQMGADLADQIVADFIRDELPRRFKALFGSQVSA